MKHYLGFLLAAMLLLAAVPSTVVAQPQVTCAQAVKATPPGPFPCQITLNWQDNSNNEAVFIVERRVNGGPWGVFNSVPANTTTMLDSTLGQSPTVDALYEYRVFAQNLAADGKTLQNSGYSNIASQLIPMAPVVIQPPTTPSGLTITFYNPDGSINQVIQLSGDLKGYLK